MEEKKERSATSQYKMDFQDNNYERINLSIKKGEKERIKNASIEAGYKSLNDFCVDAIYKYANISKPEMKTRGRKPKPKADEKVKTLIADET